MPEPTPPADGDQTAAAEVPVFPGGTSLVETSQQSTVELVAPQPTPAPEEAAPEEAAPEEAGDGDPAVSEQEPAPEGGEAAAVPTPEPEATGGRRFAVRSLVASFGLGVLVAGLVFAAVANSQATEWQGKVDALEGDLADELAAHGVTADDLAVASEKVATSDERIEEADARADEAEQALADAQAGLDEREAGFVEREATVAQREADVQAREDAVSATEQLVKDNSFSDGIWKVGAEIAPGTYRNSGGSFCHWARLSGFSGDLGDILANDLPSGSALVTIRPSDLGFETNGCGTWTLQP